MTLPSFSPSGKPLSPSGCAEEGRPFPVKGSGRQDGLLHRLLSLGHFVRGFPGTRARGTHRCTGRTGRSAWRLSGQYGPLFFCIFLRRTDLMFVSLVADWPTPCRLKSLALRLWWEGIRRVRPFQSSSQVQIVEMSTNASAILTDSLCGTGIWPFEHPKSNKYILKIHTKIIRRPLLKSNYWWELPVGQNQDSLVDLPRSSRLQVLTHPQVRQTSSPQTCTQYFRDTPPEFRPSCLRVSWKMAVDFQTPAHACRTPRSLLVTRSQPPGGRSGHRERANKTWLQGLGVFAWNPEVLVNEL